MQLESKIQTFIEKLGLDRKHFYTIEELKTLHSHDDLIIKLEKLQIDAVYFFGEIPTLLFKFSPKYDDENIYQVLLKSWNFNKAPILFYITDTDVIIYNTFIFPQKNGLKSNILGKKDDLEQYHLNHLTDELFWEKKKKEFNHKNRINKQLLKNIVDAKKLLLKKMLPEAHVHSIIGRSLFLRYIIDREIIPLDTLNIASNEDVFLNKDALYQAFEVIKKYFNGDLFPVTENEYNAISNEHLNILYSLFRGGDISTGQQSLFSFYDFSIIPIELISNIYEKFLHDGNNLKQAHYTPLATVDLVYEQLLGTSLYNKKTIKVLDPSCGSGIFLVAFLKKYFEKHPEKPTHKQIFKFIQKSLFGIDVDEDAIKITIFSIYITVLEFFEKSFIQKNNFRFPNLLNKNFFVADFFNTNADYNHILNNFDFIVGNPPWGTIQESLHLYESYCHMNSFALSDKQIAQAFMYRVNDFMKLHTIVALVLPSKIFYNIGASSFRESFLSLFDIKAMIEMSLERKKTFSEAIHPSAIVFYTKHKDKDNIFTHLTLHPSIFYDLFKVFIFSEENK